VSLLDNGEFRKLLGRFILARTSLIIIEDRIKAAVQYKTWCEKAMRNYTRINGACNPRTLIARNSKIAIARYERAFEKKAPSMDELAEAEKNLFDFITESFNIAGEATMDVHPNQIRIRSVVEDVGEGESDTRYVNYDVSTKGELLFIYST